MKTTALKPMIAMALALLTLSATGCGGRPGGVPVSYPAGGVSYPRDNSYGRGYGRPGPSYRVDAETARATNAALDSVRREKAAWDAYTRAVPPGNVGNPY